MWTALLIALQWCYCELHLQMLRLMRSPLRSVLSCGEQQQVCCGYSYATSPTLIPHLLLLLMLLLRY